MSRVRTDAPVVPLALVPDHLHLSSISLRVIAHSPAVTDPWTVEELDRIADALDTCRGALGDG